jgi:hypothetical protein
MNTEKETYIKLNSLQQRLDTQKINFFDNRINDIIKKIKQDDPSKNLECKDKFKICYKEVRKKIKCLCNSILGNLIFFFATVFSLFYFDIKILATASSADPAFELAMNIVFFILFSEFIVSILFEINYIGSFYFYLDLMDILSLIPDTQLIMNLFSQNQSQDQDIGADHLIEASSFSQAAAK